MAKIYPFFRNINVCDEEDNSIIKPVKRYRCSECGREVYKDSKRCPRCHENFTGIIDSDITVCKICGENFTFPITDRGTPYCCNRCKNLLEKSNFKTDIAKLFFELGKTYAEKK